MVQAAALTAALVLAGLIVFQVLLAAGLPMGHYAWGGQHRVLPRGLRIGSAVATLVYLLAALMILEAADVIDFIASPDVPRAAVWVLTGLFAIGVVMNAVSRSKKERVMALVSLLLASLCAVIALG